MKIKTFGKEKSHFSSVMEEQQRKHPILRR